MGCCVGSESGRAADGGGGATSVVAGGGVGYQTGDAANAFTGGGSASVPVPSKAGGSGGSDILLAKSPGNGLLHSRPAKEKYDSQPDPLQDLTTLYKQKAARGTGAVGAGVGWVVRHPTVMTTNHSVKRYRVDSAADTKADGKAVVLDADNPFAAVAAAAPAASEGGAAASSSSSSSSSTAASSEAERHVWTVRMKVAPKTFVDASLIVTAEPTSAERWRTHKLKPDVLDGSERDVELETGGGVLCRERTRTLHGPDAVLCAVYRYPLQAVRASPDPDTRALPDVLLLCLQSLDFSAADDDATTPRAGASAGGAAAAAAAAAHN